MEKIISFREAFPHREKAGDASAFRPGSGKVEEKKTLGDPL
jgi:hypothetical protein